MPDVIVIGTRAAGAATAMLLARAGVGVLAVDRASFPSDTLSTHQLHLPAVARLKRWGLLDQVIASGAPATRQVRFDQPSAVLHGEWPEHDGVDALYSPRRTVLDKLLVDAARAAGAEVREHFPVDEILTSEGRVTGIRSRAITERAPLVIGADGRHSPLAKAVKPEAYKAIPARSCAYYTYWEGVELTQGEIYGRPDRAIGAWPTNDGLTLTYVGAPAAHFPAFKADIEREMLAALDQAGDLGQRIRSGARADRFYGSADLANRFHKPHGPGWALVGDAGLVLDPITGQGISHAFRDAELLTRAIVDGTPLGAYQAERDASTTPMYDFTTELASFQPTPPEAQALFRALEGRPDEIRRFLGVIAGATPMPAYFAPRNLARVLGARGLARIAQLQLSGAMTRISSRRGTSAVRIASPSR
jgi:flavin-dependent dehydrogenase